MGRSAPRNASRRAWARESRAAPEHRTAKHLPWRLPGARTDVLAARRRLRAKGGRLAFLRFEGDC